MSLTILSIVGAVLAAFWFTRLWWINGRARHKKTADANELKWLDELVREHEAGTRDNSDYIRRLIRSIKEEHEPSTALDDKLEKAQRVLDERS
jgi:hypothetical protein